MRRHLMTAVLALFVGGVLLASDASACHHKKKGCAPAPCPTPCAVVEPCPPPAPCPEPCAAPRKKCFSGLKLFGHHKKKGCHQPAAVCEAPAPCNSCGGGTVVYAAPTSQMAWPAAQH